MYPKIRNISTLLFAFFCIFGSSAQKVFMLGDSHVNSKVYPQKVEEMLREEHPDIDFDWWAKNGICFSNFKFNPEYYDAIFDYKPDILIVHLGTNGAYDTNFTRASFRQELKAFYDVLTDSLPDVKVVFVTPFTNKRRKYKKKGTWHINHKNRDVADEIIEFVSTHPNTYVVDNNAQAEMKFVNSRVMIKHDFVHLTDWGYKVLGDQVATYILQITPLWQEADGVE